MSNRKKELVGKANNILSSGEYTSVDEIFKRVFNEEELNAIYNKSDEKNNENNEYNFDDKNKDDKGQFFTTQQG